MVPVVLDAEKLRIAIVGEGPQALGRLQMLRKHGVHAQAVFAEQAGAELRALAGDRLVSRWPGPEDLAQIDIVFAGDLTDARADELHRATHAAKVLLNTEDRRAQCDFHMPATVRRGSLLLTVSTGGGSPGLARRIAGKLGEMFGPEWSERLEQLCCMRDKWRNEGLDISALKEKTDQFIDQKGWFS